MLSSLCPSLASIKRWLGVAFLVSQVIVAVYVWFGFRVDKVLATIDSCSASVSPQILHTNTVTGLNFNIVNTDSSSIIWVKITAPSNDFEIFTGSSSGWSRSVDSPTEIRYYNGSLAAGNSGNFSVTVQTGTSQVIAEPWLVQTSDDSGGADAYDCSGDVSITVTDDTTPPEISNISVMDITSTSATVTWDTDEPADTYIEWGLDDSYGDTDYSADLVTSHIYYLSDLSADTTYHFLASSTDQFANMSQSGDNTFTTAPELAPTPTNTPTPTATSTPTPTSVPQSGGGLTPTIVPTVVLTPTPVATPTPTPQSLFSQLFSLLSDPTPTPTVSVGQNIVTPTAVITPTGPIDDVKPEVNIETDLSFPVKEAPAILGLASDNIGVVKVRYSLDGGLNWINVDLTTSQEDGVLRYEFIPDVIQDGNYKVLVQALDAWKNVGVSETKTLIIDRMPPQVGAGVSSIGSQQAISSVAGMLTLVTKLDQRIVLTAIGGATQIDILAQRLNEDGSAPKTDHVFSLVYNPSSGFWQGSFSFPIEGRYQLYARARDGAGNETMREFGMANVVSVGRILDEFGASVAGTVLTVYYYEPTLREFIVWDGQAVGQVNPYMADSDGIYRLMLNPGRYYLHVDGPGYKPFYTQIFTVDSPALVVNDLVLELENYLPIGLFRLVWPFQRTNQEITIGFETGLKELESDKLGQELPFFNVESTDGFKKSTDFYGKPSVLTFVSKWSPYFSEQASVLDRFMSRGGVNMGLVLIQEPLVSVKLLHKQGGYDVPFLADTNGEVARLLGVRDTPTHVFLDRSGKVRKIISALLNEEELFKALVF